MHDCTQPGSCADVYELLQKKEDEMRRVKDELRVTRYTSQLLLAQVARLVVVDSVRKAHCEQLQERVERTEEQMATAVATLKGTLAEHETLLESQYTSLYTVLAPEKLAWDFLQSPRDSQATTVESTSETAQRNILSASELLGLVKCCGDLLACSEDCGNETAPEASQFVNNLVKLANAAFGVTPFDSFSENQQRQSSFVDKCARAETEDYLEQLDALLQALECAATLAEKTLDRCSELPRGSRIASTCGELTSNKEDNKTIGASLVTRCLGVIPGAAAGFAKAWRFAMLGFRTAKSVISLCVDAGKLVINP